jgi:hypothetical protein
MPTIQRTPNQVAQIIENFLNNKSAPHDWDDFISLQIADPHLDAIRAQCLKLNSTRPPTKKTHWTNQAGLDLMRELATKLRVARYYA